MLIVLKNADFSENNIGHVEVPIEVSNETANILSLYGVSDLDNDYLRKAKALQTFRSDFSKLGISDKVKGLFVPVFAKTTDKAYLNLASKTFDIATIKEQTDELALTPIGIKSTGNTKPLNLNGVFDGLYTDDFHFLQVVGEDAPIDKKICSLYASGEGPSTNIALPYTQYGDTGYTVVGSNFRIGTTTAIWKQSSALYAYAMPVRRLIGLSITPASTYFTAFKPARINNAADTVLDMTNYAEWKSRKLLSSNISIKGYGNSHLTASVPFLSIGSSLTDEEIIEYDRIVIKMLNTLGTFE